MSDLAKKLEELDKFTSVPSNNEIQQNLRGLFDLYDSNYQVYVSTSYINSTLCKVIVEYKDKVILEESLVMHTLATEHNLYKILFSVIVIVNNLRQSADLIQPINTNYETSFIRPLTIVYFLANSKVSEFRKLYEFLSKNAKGIKQILSFKNVYGIEHDVLAMFRNPLVYKGEKYYTLYGSQFIKDGGKLVSTKSLIDSLKSKYNIIHK